MSDQLALDHQSQHKRFLACHVTMLQFRLGKLADSGQAFERAYRSALQSTEAELEDMRRTLESEVAEAKRGQR